MGSTPTLANIFQEEAKTKKELQLGSDELYMFPYRVSSTENRREETSHQGNEDNSEEKAEKAQPGFEPGISCLRDRRFNH